uniref:Uncharacterized protein n=1 Tax=Cannabis sativa TaxID=3483 RepID=A0A803QDH7_CANSA
FGAGSGSNVEFPGEGQVLVDVRVLDAGLGPSEGLGPGQVHVPIQVLVPVLVSGLGPNHSSNSNSLSCIDSESGSES